MSRRFRILLGALFLGVTVAQAAFPPYAERVGKYPAFPAWDARLAKIWGGWKTRFVSNGLVGGNTPGSTTKSYISEGQSYGMLLSAWFGDQAEFNTIWTATETQFWDKGTKRYYPWNITTFDANFAGDADIDIAGALIFASALVDEGIWTNTTVGGNTYKAKAKIVLQSVIDNFIDVGANYRVNSWPGAGDGIRNPSYHMPGWYPIFKEFGAANGISGMDWDKAATGAFDLIDAQPNSSKGMARNFSNGSGGSPTGGTSTPNNYDMGYDAIRVPYRMAIAATWYPNQLPRAVKWAKNVWASGAVESNQPGMYNASNATLWGWDENEYEKFLPRAMWGSLATSVKDSSAEAAAAFVKIFQDMSTSVKADLDYLDGAEHDQTLPTAPSKNYYGQSLGLMGALVMAGRAWNIWDDLKHTWTPPDTTPKLTTPLTAAPATVQLTPGATAEPSNTSTITAKFNRSVAWKVRYKGRTSGANFEESGTSNSVSLSWTSLKKTRVSPAYVSETVDVRVVAPGLDTNAASAKATITVTPSTSVLPRASSAQFSPSGFLLKDHYWVAGQTVRARILDLTGRQLVPASVSTLQPAAAAAVALPLSIPHALNVRVLEVSDLSGSFANRYLISPNP